MASQQSNSSVLIKIQEDTETHMFKFSREKLCSVSRFFQKAFQGGFLEAVTGMMNIVDVSADLFGMFANWLHTGNLETRPMEDLVSLYALADMLDIPDLRAAVIDGLTFQCFRPAFEVPDNVLIIFMTENIPRSLPIHALFAIAVARKLYHQPEGLEYLPYGFGVRVKRAIDKPYGMCDECYARDGTANDTDHCEHFDDQPTDFDPRR